MYKYGAKLTHDSIMNHIASEKVSFASYGNVRTE